MSTSNMSISEKGVLYNPPYNPCFNESSNTDSNNTALPPPYEEAIHNLDGSPSSSSSNNETYSPSPSYSYTPPTYVTYKSRDKYVECLVNIAVQTLDKALPKASARTSTSSVGSTVFSTLASVPSLSIDNRQYNILGGNTTNHHHHHHPVDNAKGKGKENEVAEKKKKDDEFKIISQIFLAFIGLAAAFGAAYFATKEVVGKEEHVDIPYNEYLELKAEYEKENVLDPHSYRVKVGLHTSGIKAKHIFDRNKSSRITNITSYVVLGLGGVAVVAGGLLSSKAILLAGAGAVTVAALALLINSTYEGGRQKKNVLDARSILTNLNNGKVLNPNLEMRLIASNLI